MHATDQKKTPLYDVHLRSGARMTSFAGFVLPLQYTSILEEHLAVRTAAGMFDVSHMGQIRVSGPEAHTWLNRLLTNDLARLSPGRCQYTLMLNPQGGILDDMVVYCFASHRWLCVVNAANIEKDVAWMHAHAPADVDVRNESDRWALIAVQGPRAIEVLNPIVQADLHRVRYYHFVETVLEDVPIVCSRTGYTGEDGFEILCPAEAAPHVWTVIARAGESAGLRCCGLGARDTLRLEAGMRLYGRDMDETTTPFEVGLERFVSLHKPDFIGRASLIAQQERGIPRCLIGLEMVDSGIPRHGYAVMNAAYHRVGHVTSGTFAPFLRKAIAMALVASSAQDRTFYVDIRGTARHARRVSLPFYRRSR